MKLLILLSVTRREERVVTEFTGFALYRVVTRQSCMPLVRDMIQDLDSMNRISHVTTHNTLSDETGDTASTNVEIRTFTIRVSVPE